MIRITINSCGRERSHTGTGGILIMTDRIQDRVILDRSGRIDAGEIAAELIVMAKNEGPDEFIRSLVREIVVNCDGDFFTELHQEDEILNIFRGGGHDDSDD